MKELLVRRGLDNSRVHVFTRSIYKDKFYAIFHRWGRFVCDPYWGGGDVCIRLVQRREHYYIVINIKIPYSEEISTRRIDRCAEYYLKEIMEGRL